MLVRTMATVNNVIVSALHKKVLFKNVAILNDILIHASLFVCINQRKYCTKIIIFYQRNTDRGVAKPLASGATGSESPSLFRGFIKITPQTATKFNLNHLNPFRQYNRPFSNVWTISIVVFLIFLFHSHVLYYLYSHTHTPV